MTSKIPQPNQAQKPQRKFSRPNVAERHKKVLANLTENGGSMRKAILDAGYSQEVADNPQKITESKTWNEIIEEALPDSELTEKHKELLNSTRVDHMVFPLGCKKTIDKPVDKDELSDEEIIEMLAEVNCKVRRIVHGESARHVYFWSNDNKARKEALDMAYKLKGRYGDDDSARKPTTNTYNFIFSPAVQDKVKIIDAEIKDMLTADNDANNQKD